MTNHAMTIAMSIAGIVVPVKGHEKESWPKEGAQIAFSVVAIHYAWTDPQRCTLGEIGAFYRRSIDAVTADLKRIAASDAPGGVPGLADMLASMPKASPGQWKAIDTALTTELLTFADDASVTADTAASDYDFNQLKAEQTTTYIVANPTNQSGNAKWLALTLEDLIEKAAAGPGDGRCLFLLDEILQLPPVPALLKAWQLYAGLGVQFHLLAQDLAALVDKFGAHAAESFEQGAAVLQAWAVREERLLKRIEMLSGRASVITSNLSASHGATPSAGMTLQESARALLQAEDVMRLGPLQQILRVDGCPLIVADRVPFYELDVAKDMLRDVRELRPSTVLDPSFLTRKGS